MFSPLEWKTTFYTISLSIISIITYLMLSSTHLYIKKQAPLRTDDIVHHSGCYSKTSNTICNLIDNLISSNGEWNNPKSSLVRLHPVISDIQSEWERVRVDVLPDSIPMWLEPGQRNSTLLCVVMMTAQNSRGFYLTSLDR